MESPESVAITAADMYPGVGVAESDSSRILRETAAAVPLQIATVIPSPAPHVTAEIRDVARRELVTAIEVLSLTNKRGDGYNEYLAKRRRILLSPAHLLEIDLLRHGRRVPMKEPLPPAPYFVFLSRAEKRPVTDVWPIALSDPLPTVPIPLLPDDGDAFLNLQAAFTAMYDLLGYDLAVDYSQRPEVALQGEAAGWVGERLKAAG